MLTSNIMTSNDPSTTPSSVSNDWESAYYREKNRADHLQEKRNSFKALSVIMLAVLFVGAIFGYLYVQSERSRLVTAYKEMNEYGYHTDVKFNRDALQGINDWREEQGLPPVQGLHQSPSMISAVMEGCAFKIGSGEWDEKECRDATNWGVLQGFPMEIYKIPANADVELGESNIPSARTLLTTLVQQSKDAAAKKTDLDGKEIVPPAILGEKAEIARIIIVGDDSDEWTVFIFTKTVA